MSPQNIPLKGRTDFRESSRILANRDYLRLSCGVRETQLGPNARMSAAMLRGGRSIAERAGIAAVSADPEMIRRRPIQQHHCSLCAGLFLQRERVWWSLTASLTGSLLSLPAPRGPLRGLGGGGAMLRRHE